MEGHDGGPKNSRIPYLPSGYRLDESHPDVAVLHRPDGTEVAAFGELADPRETERAA